MQIFEQVFTNLLKLDLIEYNIEIPYFCLTLKLLIFLNLLW